eukprot:191282-Amphidinium_carterae.1
MQIATKGNEDRIHHAMILRFSLGRPQHKLSFCFYRYEFDRDYGFQVCTGEANLSSAVDQEEEGQKVAAPWWTVQHEHDLRDSVNHHVGASVFTTRGRPGRYSRLVIRPPRATYTSTALGSRLSLSFQGDVNNP